MVLTLLCSLGKINDLEQCTRKSSVRVFGVTNENKLETAEQSIEATMGVLAKIGADVLIEWEDLNKVNTDRLLCDSRPTSTRTR